MTRSSIVTYWYMLKDGDKVPSSIKGILVDQDTQEDTGKVVSLKSLWKDKRLILYFYPRDMTPGCTTEAQDFQKNIKEFEKLNIEIAGCSRDNVKSHCKFISKQELSFPLISDDTGTITEAFEVWVEKNNYGKKYMGIQRSTFIIENGVIIKAYPKVKVKEHIAEVLEFLRAY